MNDAIDPELLRTWLNVIPARNLMVIIDAPFGARFVDAIREIDAEERDLGTNLVLLALDGISREVTREEARFGELTFTLIQGLNSSAGRTAHEFTDFFLDSHPELIPESRAKPFVFSRGSDFPITRPPGRPFAAVPSARSGGEQAGIRISRATVVEGRIPIPVPGGQHPGRLGSEVQVKVEGAAVPVDSNGSFRALVSGLALEDGEIRIVARGSETRICPGSNTLAINCLGDTATVVTWRSERIVPVPVMRGLEVGGGTGGADPPPRPGRDIVLLFATNEYDHLQNLRNPIFDAEAIAGQLEDVYGFEVHFLRNPTALQIEDTLVHYANRPDGENDRLLLFFAGHGEYDRTHTQDGVLAARNTRPASEDRRRRSAVLFNFVRRVLERATAKQVLLLLDVCYGGSFDSRIGEAAHRSDEDLYGSVAPVVYLRRKMDLTTRRYITSGGVERVPDGLPGEHSPFARRIIEALRSWGGEDRLLILAELLAQVQMLKSEPRAGSFGGDEPGSDFVLVANPEGAEPVGAREDGGRCEFSPRGPGSW